MIGHHTASGAPTNIGNSGKSSIVLFGYQSTNSISPKFTVDQMPYYLSAFNLAAGDTIAIQQVSVDGTETANFCPVFGPLQLSSNITKVRIDYPGIYQLVHSGPTPLGQFTVDGFAATMTDDNLSGLAQAIGQVVASDSITGINPVVVTGSGSGRGPWTVSFEPNTVVGTTPIVVSGVGTTASPYDVSLSTTPGSAPPNFVEVTGTAPVHVSGNGTAATPYNVNTPYITVQESSTGSVLVGYNAVTSAAGVGDIVLGSSASVTASPNTGGSIVIGEGASSVTSSAVVIGKNASSPYAGSSVNVIIGTNATFSIVSNGSASGPFVYNGVSLNIGGVSSSFNNNTLSILGTTQGFYSCSIGMGSLVDNNHGVAYGYEATAGDDSVAIGYQAGFATGVGFSNSVFIGSGAGRNASAKAGICIGYGANSTFTNCTVISDATTFGALSTQDNQIVLGTAAQTQLVTAGSIIQAGAISASDARLKTDVKDEQNALETVEKLSPVSFKWGREQVLSSKIPMNEDEFGKLQHGLIAQDVEKLLPELIENIDRGAGVYKFVRYERLIPIMLQAIKDLSAEVKELKGQKI
jgi:hypothetical protein